MKMWRNGDPVRIDDAAGLAFAGYAHFTAMQVRGGGVRGLDLHLGRLREASVQLFGQDLDEARVQDLMGQALAAGPLDLSMMVTIHPTGGEFAPPSDLDVTVRTGPPASGPQGPQGPLALSVVEHERFLPQVKHHGEGAKTYHLWQAIAAGFDDAAFVDRSGQLSEATIWNLAFFDGTTVLWPQANKLLGTTMQVLQRRLPEIDVPQREQPIRVTDLGGLSAVVMNSWTPGIAVHRIGHHHLPVAPAFHDLLQLAYHAEPLATLLRRQ